ncbi:helix-turn-helix transcriptional regulator [uncultured Senegalimassilia sp.]|uniref:response regulator transcription factor n=1 Tax=uncultured Senegalimassilia sp. TaxID=1714350 RepID=UPI0025F6E3FE|nr:helix-turn-helix transcriptional regulator [uncultured Senegalimassilia sp.]
MIDEMKANARCLGWGFLLAWVFCAFYSGSMDGLSLVVDAMGGGTARRLALSVLPVGSAVVSLVVIVAAERRLGPPTNCRALVVAAPLAVAVTTPMLSLPAFGVVTTPLLFAVSAIITGAGSALMWVMWGQLYARLPQDAVESCAPASAFVAALLSLAAMAAPHAASIALVSAYPLVSGVLLWRAWPKVSASASADHASLPAAPLPLREAFGSMGRGGFGILAACMFVSIEGSFWASSSADASHAVVIFVASALFMAVVSVSATAGPRRVSLSFAYRWMCPLMVAGFAAIIVLGAKTGAFAAAGVGIASRFAFCVITQMYFASYAARGAATPVQSYAVGWLFVHVGDLLGLLVSFPLQGAIGASAIEPSGAAAVLIVALVAAVMLALNDETRFLSWETAPVYAGTACAASASAAGSGAIAAAGVAAGETEAGHLVLRPQNVRDAGGEGESEGASAPGASAGETAVGEGTAAETETGHLVLRPQSVRGAGASASAAVGVGGGEGSASNPSSQGPQPVDFIGQRVALLAREHKLTPRETEVFGLLAHGRSIPYVRDALIISRDTAATHAKHIYTKLDVHSRQELIDLVMSDEL